MKTLGFLEHAVIDHPKIQDGRRRKWDPLVLKQILSDHITILKSKNINIDTIVTFDKDGASMHPNHMMVAQGVNYYELDNRAEGMQFYTLETVQPPLMKLGPLGLPLMTSSCDFLAIQMNPIKVL